MDEIVGNETGLAQGGLTLVTARGEVGLEPLALLDIELAHGVDGDQFLVVLVPLHEVLPTPRRLSLSLSMAILMRLFTVPSGSPKRSAISR